MVLYRQSDESISGAETTNPSGAPEFIPYL